MSSVKSALAVARHKVVARSHDHCLVTVWSLLVTDQSEVSSDNALNLAVKEIKSTDLSNHGSKSQ